MGDRALINQSYGGRQSLLDGEAIMASMGGAPVTGSTAITLAALTVSNASATIGSAFTSTISGATSGSTLSLTGAGAPGLSISGNTISGTPTTAGAVNVVETLAGATNSPRTTSGLVSVASGATAALAYPALGAAYDFDWANDAYTTVSPNIGTQRTSDNTNPILYAQMLLQVAHWVENADGSLAYRPNTAARRSTKGLHSFNGINQEMTSPRDLTNAAWIKTNATAALTAVGKDGGANAASTITFTADGGTISQAMVATGAVLNRRGRFDLKRISGADPIEISIDNGATWSSFNPTGTAYMNAFSTRQALADNTLILRGKANNSFAVDFVSLWGPRNDATTLPSLFTSTGRLSSKTTIGRDRLHHNIGTTGGTSGTEGINLVRSKPVHGFFLNFNYSQDSTVVTPIAGYAMQAFLDGRILIRRDSSSEIVTVNGARIGDGTATVGLNKFMYFTNNGVLRIALNGVLSTFFMTAPDTTATHDLFTSGAGTAMEGFVPRMIWFDDVRVPTDAEMIAWTT